MYWQHCIGRVFHSPHRPLGWVRPLSMIRNGSTNSYPSMSLHSKSLWWVCMSAAVSDEPYPIRRSTVERTSRGGLGVSRHRFVVIAVSFKVSRHIATTINLQSHNSACSCPISPKRYSGASPILVRDPVGARLDSLDRLMLVNGYRLLRKRDLDPSH